MSERRCMHMLRRKIMDDLIEWRSEPNRKPLLIKGQRQVGKTFIIREFAKTYEHSVYFDLSRDAEARKIFDGDLGTDRITTAMEIVSPGSVLTPGKTLIILDEIQGCPRARTALKSFAEDGRYDVIASGSLLDVALKEDGKNRSPELVPVGYEKQMRMYGLDFEEFLWAAGYSEKQTSALRKAVRGREPLSDTALETYQERFSEFMMTGGMPEAVSAFVSKEGMGRVSGILTDIIASFRDDIAKYSPEESTLRIRKCFESIPCQLAETNKKFMWSRIDRGGPGSRNGLRTYSDALLWIEGAGIANCCYKLREVASPVSIRKDPSQFKVYMSDTGMLINLMGPNALYAAYSKDDGFNQGALTENIVAECLMKAGIEPCYYINRKNPGRMELDFVADLGLETAVIEVKSGKDREAPSLSKTMGDGRFQRRIMFERSNIRTDGDGIEHYPIFAAAFIRDIAKPMPEMDL